MHCIYADVELRFPFRQRGFGQGRAVSLFDFEDRPDCGSVVDPPYWNRCASATSPKGNQDCELDACIPTTRLAAGLLYPLGGLFQRFSGLTIESLLILLFDQHGRCIKELCLTSGSRSYINGRFRPIVSMALKFGARKLVLAHNHPSGSPEPSGADIRFTRNLIKICAPLDIIVVDHLIVAGMQSVSLREANLL